MIKRKKGFTLTEVLIVVVIMAVLASLILPRFFGQSERAIVSEAVGMLSAIRQGEASYQLENNNYIATTAAGFSWDLLGIDNPINAKFTYAVDAAGTATATRLPAGDCVTIPFNGCTITLKSDGTWDQTLATKHPYSPQ